MQSSAPMMNKAGTENYMIQGTADAAMQEIECHRMKQQ
jgi:hypothetical protein